MTQNAFCMARELILATIDMIHQAKRRLASHIALDWRCATNPDPFAADVHSVRPNSRRAFFMRWGCLCRVNVGNYTLEECVEKARWAPRP